MSEEPRADADSIYDQLRAEIVAGSLPAGSAVREVAVATRFGVSRTPVREALRRLKHDLLLVPGARGLRVRAVGPQEVVQVYDMRVLLEAEAAREAARARSDTDVLRLEALLARDLALVAPDDEARTVTNMEFHAALWRAAGNAVLRDLLERLTVHLIRAPRSTLSVGTRWEESLQEHAEIVRAVREGDPDAAGSAAAEHMQTAREIRLSLLRDAFAEAAPR